METQFADIENPAIELVTMDISTTQEKASLFTWSYRNNRLHRSKSCPNTLRSDTRMSEMSLTSYHKEDLDNSNTSSPMTLTREKQIFAYIARIPGIVPYICSINKYESINHHFSIFMHVSIMISFEIFFYFTYIVNIERNEILKKIGNYVAELKRAENEEEIIAIDFFIDTQQFQDFYTKTYNDYLESKHEQKEKLAELLATACYVGIPFYFMFLLFFSYGVCRRKKIRWGWLVYENLFMFLCLGIFEYLFFTQVILQYDPITDAELEYYLVSEFM